MPGRFLILFIFLVLVGNLALSGCTAAQNANKPVIWTVEGLTLPREVAFEIQPTFNATRGPLNREILPLLNAYLKKQFIAKQLPVTEQETKARMSIIVRTELLSYTINQQTVALSAGWPPASQTGRCIILTRLVSRASGTALAELTTFTVRGISPGNAIPGETHEWLLQQAAIEVADAVAKLVQHAGPA